MRGAAGSLTSPESRLKCPLCGSRRLPAIFDVPSLPALCGLPECRAAERFAATAGGGGSHDKPVSGAQLWVPQGFLQRVLRKITERETVCVEFQRKFSGMRGNSLGGAAGIINGTRRECCRQSSEFMGNTTLLRCLILAHDTPARRRTRESIIIGVDKRRDHDHTCAQ
jgi:hypothetical protein